MVKLLRIYNLTGARRGSERRGQEGEQTAVVTWHSGLSGFEEENCLKSMSSGLSSET